MGKNEWPVWVEGLKATGQSSDANFCGFWPGETFVDACRNYANSLPAEEANLFEVRNGKPTFWACKFFDNETDARKSFG